MYLYNRAKKIIELFKYNDSIHIDKIANLINISPRTINNDIVKINFVLKNKNLDQIKQNKKYFNFK
jgi:transcriptional antiterminator